jgi:hypothetical protein
MDHDEDNTQIFIDNDLITKLTTKVESELCKNDLLSPVTTTATTTTTTTGRDNKENNNNFTLADESLNTLTAIPSSTQNLYNNVLFFLFLNEFCLTIADYPTNQTKQVQILLDSKVPLILIKIIQFLTKITNSKMLIGKGNALSTTSTGLSALKGIKKINISPTSFISMSTPSIMAVSLTSSSFSSTSYSLCGILSSVYHSFSYSSLSALLNLLKFSEQTQLNQLINDDNLNILSTVVIFLTKVAYHFIPVTSTFKNPFTNISSHYFPSFLIRALNIVQVCSFFCCCFLFFFFVFCGFFFCLCLFSLYA